MPNRMPDQEPVTIQHEEEEVHLQDYLAVLYRRRKVALIAFVAVVVAVVAWTLWMKPVYEASSTLHVKDEKVKGGDFLSDLGLSRENPVETEIEILRSRTNAEETVRRLNLNWVVKDAPEELRVHLLEFEAQPPAPDKRPEYRIRVAGDGAYGVRDADGGKLGDGMVGKRFQAGGLTLMIDKLEGAAGQEFTLVLQSFQATAKALREAVHASEVGKGTNIIRLSYQDTDPRKAAAVVNTLAGVYLERSVMVKAEEARKSVEFIQSQLDQVRGMLDSAEQKLQDYKSQSGVVRLDAEAEALIEQMSEADKAKSAARLRKQQAAFAVEALRKALASGAGYAPAVLLDDPVLAELAKTLAQLEVERQGLLVDYTPDHPRLQAVADRIAETQRKMLQSYQVQEQALASRIAELDSQLAGFEAQLRRLPAAEQQLARLTRLATVNADIYTFLLQKHEEARIARAATISSINVIDPAIAPAEPVKPNKKKNLLLALVVGAMLGVGLAFFLEYLDDTIKDAEAAKRLLGLPVLAVIPHIGRPGKKGGEVGVRERNLVSYLEPKSGPAEAFRALRTAIHFSGREKKQVLVVTSTFPGEGKTTCSANLAETMAQTGSRVVLLGCDLRRPTLHAIFDHPQTPGLTEYLVGDCAVEDIIRKTQVGQLNVISAGTNPPNPAELLGSARMTELIERLRVDYDFIVLDAPPMLAVTDSTLLAALADLVVVVLEAGGVKVKAAQRMKELLQTARAPVAGLALNDKSGKGFEYYSYYRDQYGRYGYGQYGYEEDVPEKRGIIGRIFKK